MAPVSLARRLRDLAAADPDRVALVVGEERLTAAGLDAASEALAHDLVAAGVEVGDMVTVALPNSLDWFVAFAAAWKVGAVPQPVSARLPERELTAIVELADPPVVIGVEPGRFEGRLCLPMGGRPLPSPPVGADPLPDVVSPAWKAPTSGGSTGRPKLIVSGDPALIDPEADSPLMMQRGGCLVMPGPLYHNGPLIWSWQQLLAAGRTVVQPRFDAEGVLALIEEHRADIVYLVPTMMKRIWRLPEEVRGRYDLSSLRIVWHLAEPCPDWLKQVWLDWLGPERIVELYGGTEGQAATVITGPEWLAHRGSVGRPAHGEVRICDPDGNDLAPGEQGEVWLRSTRGTPTYRYVGASPREREGGWESLGDMGWVDADGYLYLGDRAADMILVGGANVYPAEIEAALQEHPAVRSVVVLGLPDEDKGSRIHALVEADPAEVSEDDLRSFASERLVRYKVPQTWEYVEGALRDDAGKVRRAALRAERLGA